MVKLSSVLKSKKSASSHIEIIISFSIFFLFLLFLFSFLNPIKRPDISEVLLDIVQNGMEKDYTVSLIEVPVVLKTIPGKSCFSVNNPFVDTINQKFTFVESASGKNLLFSLSGNLIYIQTAPAEDLQDFYKIYYSDKEFVPKTLSSVDCDDMKDDITGELNYEFSISRLNNYYLYENLAAMKAEYDALDSYTQLKTKFAFPATFEFAVTIAPTDGSPAIVEMKNPGGMQKPSRVTVRARDIPVDVIKIAEDGSGTKEKIKATLNIQVW